MAGLADAGAFLDGERNGFAVHEIEAPEPDVAAIRDKKGCRSPSLRRASVYGSVP